MGNWRERRHRLQAVERFSAARCPPLSARFRRPATTRYAWLRGNATATRQMRCWGRNEALGTPTIDFLTENWVRFAKPPVCLISCHRSSPNDFLDGSIPESRGYSLRAAPGRSYASPTLSKNLFHPERSPFAHAGTRNLLLLYLKLEVKCSRHPFGCAM